MTAGARSRRRPATGSFLAGLLISLLAGCGGDEPTTPDDPTPSASSSGADQPTGSPAVDPTEDPSANGTEVAPAAGLLLEEETSQLNAPEGDWKPIPDVVDYATAVGRAATTEVISLSDRENFAEPVSLDEQVRFHGETLPAGAVVERQPDVLLDGEPAYYVQWYEKGDTKVQHDIGVDRGNRVIQIQMDLDREDAEASAALVAAVVASFRWR